MIEKPGHAHPEQTGYREQVELINAMTDIIEPPKPYDELPLADYPQTRAI